MILPSTWNASFCFRVGEGCAASVLRRYSVRLFRIRGPACYFQFSISGARCPPLSRQLVPFSCRGPEGAPHPRIPVKVGGTNELHAAFLNESRTRYPGWRSVRELRGISLVFREMWDTADLNLLCR